MAKRRIRDLEDGEQPIAIEKESPALGVFTNAFLVSLRLFYSSHHYRLAD